MAISDNIKRILKEIGNAKLVCVTKTVDPDRINESIKAGARIIGENRVQEYEEKHDKILPCERHLIGHLQTNKVKKAVLMFDVIQSVDSMRLLQEIDSRAKSIDKVQTVYLQVNIGDEEQKFGFGTDEIRTVIHDIPSLKNIQVKGLMCIPPFVPPEQARPYFREMRSLFEELKNTKHDNINIKELSMGMSNDYNVAIEEGATMVRIGSAIFGDRGH